MWSRFVEAHLMENTWGYNFCMCITPNKWHITTILLIVSDVRVLHLENELLVFLTQFEQIVPLE